MKFWLIILLLSGCCTPKIKLIHEPVEVPNNCIFEKFTESEKALMSNSIGQRIYRNQERCRLRNNRINDIINAHNQEHGDK